MEDEEVSLWGSGLISLDMGRLGATSPPLGRPTGYRYATLGHPVEYIMHYKWKAGESPLLMSGSHLCIPRNETLQPPYFQNRIIMFSLPILTLIYLWEIYLLLGSVCLFCCSQISPDSSWEYINRSQTHECGNWDWGPTIPRKGIHKGIFVAVCKVKSNKNLGPECTLLDGFSMIFATHSK